LKEIYSTARSEYHDQRIRRIAKSQIVNLDDYLEALKMEDGKLVDIHMRDGLKITLRRDRMDAVVVAEIFFDNCYLRDLSLPPNPIVVDIGGFIGDFALYAAARLRARRVVVCEPSPRNWLLLVKNIQDNHCEDRVIMVNKAVTDGRAVMLDIEAPDRGGKPESPPTDRVASKKKPVDCISLAALLEEFKIPEMHLLKIDCEGGEYEILLSISPEVLAGIRNIVFEYHEIDGFSEKLKAVRERLVAEGFAVKTRGGLVAAVRPVVPVN